MRKGIFRDLPRYLMGAASIGLSLYFLLGGKGRLSILVASAFLLAICLTDTLYSRIPNLLTVSLALSGFVYQFWLSGVAGLQRAGIGLLVGFALFLLPFLLGGMGGGDVKALAALGALLGPRTVFQVFLYTALFGGALSVLHFLMRGDLIEKVRAWRAAFLAFLVSKDGRCLKPSFARESLRFPYATAIAFGYFSYLHWGTLFWLKH